MSGAVQYGAPFPPPGPTTVQKIIPSYLYQEYQDDYWVPYFVTAYNIMSQEWLDWINLINLPVWPSISGALLDWIGAGVYGYPRPQLSITQNLYVGGYNTTPYNTIAYNDQRLISGAVLLAVTDDVYRRCLTWHLYVGDGFQFTTKWLKKRVHRFINGTNGYLAVNDTTEDVSVTWSGSTATISLVTQPISSIFEIAVIDGVLRLPFQYDFVVNLT